MSLIKTGISIIGVILAFVAYIPYFRDTIQGKTTPHIYSWFIWGFLTSIVYALQVAAGAGVGSWVTLSVAVISFLIFFLGLKNGKKDITKTDTVFFVLSLIALFLWWFAKQPVLSVILAVSIDMLGFIPTIRKSWNKPYSETLSLYEINSFRHLLSLFALQTYNIVTWLNPAVWILANGLFSLMLLLRRRRIAQK
ncbi:MAG TPA: hypothetical protein VMR81_02325 [Patescibacteria group bacterium]|nr:hypothetical protein [Patescibacteria group bacterium]